MSDSEEFDPEEQRLNELLQAMVTENISPAEREELKLYIEDGPELERALSLCRTQLPEAKEEWLQRVESHQKLEKVENSRPVLIERSLGLTMLLAGYLGSGFFPVASLLSLCGRRGASRLVLRSD